MPDVVAGAHPVGGQVVGEPVGPRLHLGVGTALAGRHEVLTVPVGVDGRLEHVGQVEGSHRADSRTGFCSGGRVARPGMLPAPGPVPTGSAPRPWHGRERPGPGTPRSGVVSRRGGGRRFTGRRRGRRDVGLGISRWSGRRSGRPNVRRPGCARPGCAARTGAAGSARLSRTVRTMPSASRPSRARIRSGRPWARKLAGNALVDDGRAAPERQRRLQGVAQEHPGPAVADPVLDGDHEGVAAGVGQHGRVGVGDDPGVPDGDVDALGGTAGRRRPRRRPASCPRPGCRPIRRPRGPGGHRARIPPTRGRRAAPGSSGSG